MCFFSLYRVKFFMSRVKPRWVFLSNSFQAYVMFSFPLAYSYIQCTDAIWLVSVYDADTGNQDQHPGSRWSSWALRVSWWASLHPEDFFLSFVLVFQLKDDLGSCPGIPICFRGFIDSQTVSSSVVFTFSFHMLRLELPFWPSWMFDFLSILNILLFKWV